jgi:hypothetical protein
MEKWSMNVFHHRMWTVRNRRRRNLSRAANKRIRYPIEVYRYENYFSHYSQEHKAHGHILVRLWFVLVNGASLICCLNRSNVLLLSRWRTPTSGGLSLAYSSSSWDTAKVRHFRPLSSLLSPDTRKCNGRRRFSDYCKCHLFVVFVERMAMDSSITINI